MTTIRATCPSCGDVELQPRDMRLVVCTHVEWSYYAFSCPNCRDRVQRHADEEVVGLLMSGGVLAEQLHVPDEVFEEHSGPPLTYDDLLDFALSLRASDDLVAGVGALGG
jgi:predicted RNA-binding Zn-ribbon protein involved in translation (DUF1610 family)